MNDSELSRTVNLDPAQGPDVKLTDEQRAELAGLIDSHQPGEHNDCSCWDGGPTIAWTPMHVAGQLAPLIESWIRAALDSNQEDR